MASSKKWQTEKYKQAVSKAKIKTSAWVYSKRKIAAEDAAFFAELFKQTQTPIPDLVKVLR